MRIVCYNVNGLRARVAQAKSLANLLDSLNADIICFQETKVCRQELTSDVAIVEGYESFFSFNRLQKRGRVGYSGVATFCKISASSSPVLPLAADEGFTGLLHSSKGEGLENCKGRVGCYEEVFKTDLTTDKLLRLDSEGRCLVTDHGAFVLFNIYAPKVGYEDHERQEFRTQFFAALKRRWDGLLKSGRRVIAVGDFNVAPYPIDHCEPDSDFEKPAFRRWFRTILAAEGGPFQDAFRLIHPNRSEAYTCWSQAIGAEEFNYGVRIDFILIAGPCEHEGQDKAGCKGTSHSFAECEVEDVDILTSFRRSKGDSLPRWHGGRSLRLEGSDHAPVFVQLKVQAEVEPHEVPPLAARYLPELKGRQLDLVSLLKRKLSDDGKSSGDEGLINKQKGDLFSSKFDASVTQKQKQRKLQSFFSASRPTRAKESSAIFEPPSGKQDNTLRRAEPIITCHEVVLDEKNEPVVIREAIEGYSGRDVIFEEKLEVVPALTASSAFGIPVWRDDEKESGVSMISIECAASSSQESSVFRGKSTLDDEEPSLPLDPLEIDLGARDELEKATGFTCKQEALGEWKRIKNVMTKGVPLCKGHKEPCVARVVKKAGTNVGRSFYVCARAKGPPSNPEARCNHFAWNNPNGRRRTSTGAGTITEHGGL